MFNIIRRLAFHHRGFLVACSTLLFVFQLLLCAIVSSINLPATLDQFMFFAPPVIRTIIEQSMLGSDAGIIAFSWNHPITHALLTAVAIALGAAAVAGEIENGAIELVLAQPVSRSNYLTAYLTFGMLSIALVACAGLLGTIVGQAVFELDLFGLSRLLQLVANAWLLQMCFYSLTLLFSSFARESGRAAIPGMLSAIVSYLVNVVATLWNKAAFMEPFSLHTYYDTRDVLVQGDLAAFSVIVLGVFSCVSVAAAFARFLTRDLP